MQFEFASSFDRRFKTLSPERQQKARAAIEALLAYLDHRAPLRPGLGLKNFRKDYWEIRIDIHDRIIFELTDRVVFWLVGNHEEIRRFMRGR
jgi:mRNA-degrading endonuclease YafQ of YafQ-DinJ toxin-antitoxin module